MRENAAAALHNDKREFEFKQADFDFLTNLVKKTAGITIAPHKKDMVYGRISRRLRALNLRSFQNYCQLVASAEGVDELEFCLNALTTNLTKFFREMHHFEHLGQKAMPEKLGRVKKGEPKKLRVWSTASSSGEEPYSIAMTLVDSIPDLNHWDARILATDIDTNMIQKCRAGLYTKNAVKGLPKDYAKRFTRVQPDQSGMVFIVQDLKSLITFNPLNLHEEWPMKGPFDIIFCRNVAIYFDKPTQKKMFERFYDYLTDEGYLYIGHSENLGSLTDRFKLVGNTIYKKNI